MSDNFAVIGEAVSLYTGNQYAIKSSLTYVVGDQIVSTHPDKYVYDHTSSFFNFKAYRDEDEIVVTVDGTKFHVSLVGILHSEVAINYVEFFVNQSRQPVNQVTGLFKTNPYVDITDIYIWSD